MLELDIGKMEFSITDFPPGGWRSQRTAIVEAGEGRHGMFFLQKIAWGILLHLPSVISLGETMVRVPTSGRWRSRSQSLLDTGMISLVKQRSTWSDKRNVSETRL
jgi:hypothetical protein